MNIKQIEIRQIKNLGNYESVTLSLNAELAETDDVNKAIDDLKTYIGFKLNESERESKLTKYTEELETADLSDSERKLREDWIEQYKTFKEKINTLEFVNGE